MQQARIEASRLMSLGYHVLPLLYSSKKPIKDDWLSIVVTPDNFDAYFPEGTQYNLGLICGSECGDGWVVSAIDVDVEGDALLLQRIRLAFRDMPATRLGRKGAGFIVRAPVNMPLDQRVFDGKGGRKVITYSRPRGVVPGGKIEFFFGNKQLAIPPSIHPDTNRAYEWSGGELGQASSLPTLDSRVAREILLAFRDPESPYFLINDMEWRGPGGGGSIDESLMRATGAMTALGLTDEEIFDRVEIAVSRVLSISPNADQWDHALFVKRLRNLVDDARSKGFDVPSTARMSRPDRRNLLAEDYVARGGGIDNYSRVMGVFRHYREGWWRAISYDQLKYEVLQIEGVNSWAEAADASRIADKVIDRSRIVVSAPRHDYVKTRGGTVDLVSGQVAPDDRAHYLTYQLPFEYDPAATCPKYDEFVVDMFSAKGASSEDIRLAVHCFEEYAGLSFVNDSSFHKMLVIEGPTGTGKSTLLRLLTSAHTPESRTAVNFDRLTDERVISSMAGKLLAYAEEIGPDVMVDAGTLKQLVDGSTMQIRLLYQEAQEVPMMARIVVACNELFKHRDASDAVNRRMLILKSRETIDPSKINRNLLRELVAEMPGVFNRWVAGLRRLRENGEFSEPTYMKQEVLSFSEYANALKPWIRDRTIEGSLYDDPDFVYDGSAQGDGTPVSDLYRDYRDWAKDVGMKEFSMQSFAKRLGQMGWDTKIRRLPRGEGRTVATRVKMLHLINKRAEF